MGLTRYFLHDFWTAREFDQLDEELERARIRSAHHQDQLLTQLEDLERDIGRLTLTVRALVDVCLAKGLFEKGELTSRMKRIDLSDGVEDGRTSGPPLG